MCVEREREREKERKRISSPSSLLLKLKLCYHSTALSTNPPTTRQPASNRLSFRVRIPTLQLRQSFSSLYLSFPIPETRLQRTLYNILPLPLRILHKDCFCSFSYFFIFFLYLIYFYYYYFVVYFFSCRLNPRITRFSSIPAATHRAVLLDFIYLFLFFSFMFFVSRKIQRFTFACLRVLHVYVVFKRKYEKLLSML